MADSGDGFQARVWRNGFRKALVLENPHPSLDGYLRDQGIEVERLDRPPKSEDELVEILADGGHNLLFKRSRVKVTERVVLATPNLHAVMLCCIGDDSVDRFACARAGVLVTNDPISNGRSVTELVLGQTICMSRRLYDAARETEQHQWVKTNRNRYELKGKTMGVVGLGNIGKQVANVANALGMDVIFHDNREVAQEVGETLGWTLAESIQEVFARSHVVTLHLSAEDHRGKTNENIIDRDTLMTLGTATTTPGPRIFINVARGCLFQPENLLAAIEEGVIEQAYVDVFPQEPHHGGESWVNPYASCPSVLNTPHIGAATTEAQPRIARHVGTTTRLLNTLGRVRNCVYSPRYPIGVEMVEGAKFILTAVHSDKRGTKRSIDEAIYDAGVSNLSSAHRDFPKYGVAYDVSTLDGPLSDEQIHGLIDRAASYTGQQDSIRSLRLIRLPTNGR